MRLFIENPAWTLRKPKEFLSDLLETCLDNMSRDSPNVCCHIFSTISCLKCFFFTKEELLELATSALCALLQTQPALLDLIPSFGHIPRICRQMGLNTRLIVVPKSAILILRALSSSSVSCITCLYVK